MFLTKQKKLAQISIEYVFNRKFYYLSPRLPLSPDLTSFFRRDLSQFASTE